MQPYPDQLSSYNNEQMRAWNEFMLAPMMGAGRPYEPIGKATTAYYGFPAAYALDSRYGAMSNDSTTDGTGPEVSGSSDIGGGAADGAAGSY